jgi:plastocyanin
MRILKVGGMLSAAALATGLLLPPDADAATTTVNVQMFGFSPTSATVGLSGRVTWQFKDTVDHTTTSDQGFWNSGRKSEGEHYSITLRAAGTFTYHCAIHTEMTGKIRVPLKVSGTPSTGYTVRWSSYRRTPASRGFDVQYHRAGSKKWITLRRDSKSRSMHFEPSRPGTYVLRARTRNHTTKKASGWSPRRSVKIS